MSSLSLLFFLDDSDALILPFFTDFFGMAIKKVSTPIINEAITVPMVLDLDILYFTDILATKKVGMAFSQTHKKN